LCDPEIFDSLFRVACKQRSADTLIPLVINSDVHTGCLQIDLDESIDHVEQKHRFFMDDKDIGPCHISGIPLQKGSFPFCKGEKPRCLAGE
jgi:hypothetical protein